jgi:hypothetical protein
MWEEEKDETGVQNFSFYYTACFYMTYSYNIVKVEGMVIALAHV